MSTNYSSNPYSTNGNAIAGFVLSLICCAPLGIVFSALALSQINRNQNQNGKGMAIAGLVIGISLTFLALVFFLISLASPFWNDFWNEFWIAFEEGFYGNTYQV